MSATRLLTTTFTRIMPTPPPFFTAALLSTRVFAATGLGPPRSQTTILPAILAGSITTGFEKHWRRRLGSAPGRPLALARSTLAGPTAGANEAPVYLALLPSVSEAVPL